MPVENNKRMANKYTSVAAAADKAIGAAISLSTLTQIQDQSIPVEVRNNILLADTWRACMKLLGLLKEPKVLIKILAISWKRRFSGGQ
ncbi:hypothetical protein FKM82_028680 [Ascaphus truei]